MVTASDILTTLRSYLGTPFEHQGRQPGRGLDCVGALVCALRANGVTVEDWRAYPAHPDEATFLRYLDRNLERVPLDRLCPADVLGFRIGRRLVHAGVRTEFGGMIDVRDRRTLRETTSLTKTWQGRLFLAWRVPGVLP